MLVIGKRLSLRLLSTLKLFAAVSSPRRYSFARAVIASLSFSHSAARLSLMMPKTFPAASKAASMSLASSAPSM